MKMFSTIKLSSQLQLLVGVCRYSYKVAKPLRSTKPKSTKNTEAQEVMGAFHFYLYGVTSLPDLMGEMEAMGGHVIFEASYDIKHFSNVPTIVKAEDGIKGSNKDCHGKNANHYIIKVPVGTIVKNAHGKEEREITFLQPIQSNPRKFVNMGAQGEDLEYTIEIRSMAHVGLIGFPNAGKSTLLRAISRARPKVAPYPFTTLKPHLGMVQYDDYEQIAGMLSLFGSWHLAVSHAANKRKFMAFAICNHLSSIVLVADLPGLIPDSHKNKGLGIQFLQHVERCMALLYIVDVSLPEPWEHLNILRYELLQFNDKLKERPQLVIANKIDIVDAKDIIGKLKENTDLPVIPISAKLGTNLLDLLREIRILYDKSKELEQSDKQQI
ncbi:hypothetical protein NQ314_016710 [Rhamnusium bicolor]|uniref:OBG-type G domain-containing protein n=1 Tax=Rhamnusium bicolor TaxID=1586634 RepID=A0AAV8WVS4_9CUCU|nr:hypothetical protein NQ314_016710 [Rhamnusium bicolor]